MSTNEPETSFKDYLRGLEPETHIFARSILAKIKDLVISKVRSGATGEISGSTDLCALTHEYPIIWKKDIITLPKKLFHKQTAYTIHLDLSILPKIVDAMPFLKQFAAEEGITVSDPYFILKDYSSGEKKVLTFQSSHITYDYYDSPGLDGWEQRVWADAYLNYSITI